MNRNIVRISLFVLAFLVLFYLRMVPAIGNSVEFRFDRAFHYRMTDLVVQKGSLPLVDHLSTYPEGKNIRVFLPTGMYYACSLFHKLINIFAEVSLNHSVLFFCSFFGSLIFIPLYFLSYDIYREKRIAYLTAFLAGIIPAYLHRTLCYWFRQEVMGVPILFTSLLFFLKALSASQPKKIFLYSVISALFMIAALYVWRLSILFLMVYAIVILFLWLKNYRFPKDRQIIPFVILGVFLLLPLCAPGFGTKSFVFSYVAFPRAAFEIITYKLGMKQTLSDFTRLIYYNRELLGVGLPGIFDGKALSLSGIFALFYIFVYFKNRKTNSLQKDVLFVFLIFFFILTFTFLRNKIILGSIVCLTLGESINFAFKNKNAIAKGLLIVLIIIISAKTGYDSCRLAATRYGNIKIRPYLKQALNAIDRLAREDSVILCHWPEGYPIQTYCHRPTITDGLFESPEIVKRIMTISKIYYSSDEDRLGAFCKKYGVTHILVPVNKKMDLCRLCGG